MRCTDLLLVGFGQLNQQIAKQALGWQVLAMRRTPGPGVLVQDARQPWQTAIKAKVVMVAVSADERTPQGYADSYLAVAKQIKAAIDQGVLIAQSVIWVSSTRVIGNASGYIDDHTQAQPSDEAGKVLADCEAVVGQMGCATTVARLTGIYGMQRQWMLRQWQAGKLHGDGTLTNRIEESDAARALLFIAQQHRDCRPVPSTVLVTDQESVSRHDIALWFDQQLGDLPEVPASSRQEAQTPSRSGRKMSPVYLTEQGFCWRYPSFRYGYLPWLAKLNKLNKFN